MSLVLSLSLLLLSSTNTQELPEGHSGHGQAFDEGPRQAAYLMPNNGMVHFPISTEDGYVQEMFDQGIGQLHGFWYFEAERSFRQVAALDPDCTLAYFGMAMANRENPGRAGAFAHEAWLRRDLATEREYLYAQAIARLYDVNREELDPDDELETTPTRRSAFLEDLEAIVEAYPDDVEGKALMVNQYWHDSRDKTMSKSRREELLQEVLTQRPDHPAHHYRIHLWDEAATIERAVDSAGQVGPAWPSVAHQWHMGGHVYDRLDRYLDAAWQQEASARVDHAHMRRDLVLPDRIHNFAHNNEWLNRSLRKAGRARYAIELAKNAIEIPRHPRWNGPDIASSSAQYGPGYLLATLDEFELWEELIALSSSPYFDEQVDEAQQVERAYLLGKAHAFLADDDGFDEALFQLEEYAADAQTSRVRRDAEGRMAILSTLFDALGGRDVEESLEVLEDEDLDDLTLARLCTQVDVPEEAQKFARKLVDQYAGRALPLATLAHALERGGRHA